MSFLSTTCNHQRCTAFIKTAHYNFFTKYVFLIHGSPSYWRHSMVLSPILGLISHLQTFSFFPRLAYFIHCLSRLSLTSLRYFTTGSLPLKLPGSFISLGPTPHPPILLQDIRDSSFNFSLCHTYSSVFPFPQFARGQITRLPAS